MKKSQFIYRNGVAATVTKLDGTSYTTRILYHLQTRSSQFSETMTFTFNFLRDGEFMPNVDIKDGYIVDVASANEKCIVTAQNNNIDFGVARSISTEMLIIDSASTQLQRRAKTVDNYGHPTGDTWNLVGTYPATFDYRNGKLAYKGDLLLADEQLVVLMQNTVPAQKGDRLVMGSGTAYQVNSLDFETSNGLIFIGVELDKRS